MPEGQTPARIVLARRFRLELQRQLAWIDKDDSRAADAAAKRVRVAVARLARFPQLGRSGRIEGTRELVVLRTRFIVVYRLGDGKLDVLALMHSSQDWPQAF